MKLIVIKRNLAKRHLFMFINLIPAKDKGQRGGGGERRGLFIKEQWEKSLLSLGHAVIFPIISHCRIALFIPSMSSVRQKELNNVFVHHKCECTCWRYSKKKQNQEQSNTQYTVKSTMNVFT